MNAIKIGRRACVAAMDAAAKMESLFAAIDRLSDSSADSETIAILARMGSELAASLGKQMDRDETALMKLDP